MRERGSSFVKATRVVRMRSQRTRRTQAVPTAMKKSQSPRRVSSRTQVMKKVVTSRVKHHFLNRVWTGMNSRRKLKRMIASLALRIGQCLPRRVGRLREEDEVKDLNLCNYKL